MNANLHLMCRSLAVATMLAIVVFGLGVQGAPVGSDEVLHPEVGRQDVVSDSLVLVTAASGGKVAREVPTAIPAVAVRRLPAPANPEAVVTNNDEHLRRARAVSSVPAFVGQGGVADTQALGDLCTCDVDCDGLDENGGCRAAQCIRLCSGGDNDGDECLVPGDCPDGTCAQGTCTLKNRATNTLCDDDGDWCTLDRCVISGDPPISECMPMCNGACTPTNHMTPCRKVCGGGTQNDKWCDFESDCPGGSCLAHPDGFCDSTGNYCWVSDDGAETGDELGRCCREGGIYCNHLTEADCAATLCDGDLFPCTIDDDCAGHGGDENCMDPGNWVRIGDPDDRDHCICPAYSSGIAPAGTYLTDVFRVVPGEGYCHVGGNRCEATGTASPEDCHKRCVSGVDDGNACSIPADCDSNVCNPDTCDDDPFRCDGFIKLGDDYDIANGSYLRLKEFRFRGGVENPDEELVFEFWDNSVQPLFVDEFLVSLPAAGIHDWTIEVDCYDDCRPDRDPYGQEPDATPFIIPHDGFVVMRSARVATGDNYAWRDEANGHWVSTTWDADVGGNDPEVLWVNYTRGLSDETDPGPNVMIFELVGHPIPDPLGACCNTSTCDDTVEWGCGYCTLTDDTCDYDRSCPLVPGDSNDCTTPNWFGPNSHEEIVFYPEGSELCGDPDPCFSGACCEDGACTVTEEDSPGSGTCNGGAGEWGPPGSRCDPNCCDQDYTGSDCAYDMDRCQGPTKVCRDAGGTCTTDGDCDTSEYRTNQCVLDWSDEECDPGDDQCAILVGTGYTCEICTGPTMKTLLLPYQCLYGDSVFADPAMRCVGDGSGCSDVNPCAGGQGPCVETYVDCDPALPDSPQCWYDDVILMQETCQRALGTRVSVAFHGDSTYASLGYLEHDRCAWRSADDSWWEGVIIPDRTPGDTSDDCAYLIVDLCCNPYIPGTFYFMARSGDGPCTGGDWVYPDLDEYGQMMYGFGDDCNNDYCCDDGNPSMRFTVRPGTYRYAIWDQSICNGHSSTFCDTDQDCLDAGDGDTCISHKREYKGHFSVEPCPLAACCDGSDCYVTNRLACEEDLEGVWLGPGAVFHPTVVCNPDPDDVCEYGACCVGPGECEDDAEGDGMTEAECTDPGSGGDPDNTYLGGITCENDPCPVCAFAEDTHCQFEDPDSNYMYVSDRGQENGGTRVAEDFTPLSGTITHVCYVPGFYDPFFNNGAGQECAARPPQDDWLLRFFADGGGLPGSELAPVGGQTLDTDDIQAKIRRGANSRLYDYQAALPTPVSVTPNECYWMELSGYGELGACQIYLSGGGPANRYAFRDTNGDGAYDVDEFDTLGIEFCLQLDGGMAADGCGDVYGECCTCPAVCTPNQTAYGCTAAEDGDPAGMEGVWHLGETCAVGEPLECPGVPDNDDCVDATVISGLTAGDVQIEYNNICSTDDGSGTLSEGDCDGYGPNFHYDVWYSYVAECSGTFTVSSCGLVAFDQMIAIYDGSGGCTPNDDIACGDDTCGVSAGPSEVSINVVLGDEVLIRVGGWYDEPARNGNPRGFGEILFSLEGIPPSANPPLPMPMESGTKLSCTTHADCDVSPGDAGSACVRDICYNPMNRYLAIEPNNDWPVAFRVTMTASKFHPGAVGMPMWVDEPECYSDRGFLLGDDTYPCDSGNGEFWLSDVLDTMPAMRLWDNSMPLYIGDCFISPVATYAMVATDDGGATFSDPTYMPTIFDPAPFQWADVIGLKDGGNGWWTGPNKVTSYDDVNSAIKFFEGVDAVLPKLPAVDVDPQAPDHTITFADIQRIIEAFQGNPYPFGDADDPCGTGGPPCECSDSAECDDGLFCNGAETCDGCWCHPGIDPCPGQACDEVDDECVGCTEDEDCDDDLFCNGAETCVAARCIGGGDPCFGQGCDENTDTCGAGPAMKWVPVGATGDYSIDGNTITLPTGSAQDVTLEFHLAGWGGAPGTPALGTFQGAIDPSGYSSGLGVPLTPLGWPGDPGLGAFQDPSHPLWICDYQMGTCITAVSMASIHYVWGSSFLGGQVVDPGFALYAGTLILEVPADAAGTYTIACHPSDLRTFLNDENGSRIPDLALVPAIIKMVAECDGDADGNTLVNFDDLLLINDCARGVEPPENCTKADVNGDGVVDICDYDIVVCLIAGGMDCCGSDVICGACCTMSDGLAPCTTATQVTCEDSLIGEYEGNGTTCAADRCDCDGDNLPDVCNVDCDALEETCDVTGCGDDADCDGNDILDSCDIRDGTLCDVDENGIPDLCQALCASCDPFEPQGIDVASTGAAFKIVMVEAGAGKAGEIREFTGLSDTATAFGRTDPHYHGDENDDEPAVPNGGYPNTSSVAPEPCALSPGFPEDTLKGQEFHVELLSLSLTNGRGASVLAGQAFYDSVAAAGHPDLYRNSFGEVQGLCIDFPAEAYFNLYVEVDLGDRSPLLHNKTPIVVRASGISMFPPGGAAEQAFIYDSSFPAVSLFDVDGVHRAYLVSMTFGDEDVADLPPSSCETQPGIADLLSFTVSRSSAGVPISAPNGVRDEALSCLTAPQTCTLPVTVYTSSGDPAGWEPDTTNDAESTLSGICCGDPGEFDSTDAINSLSFGRDGTVNLFSSVQSPALFFSVDDVTVGEHCTDVWLEAPLGRDQAAADIYTAPMTVHFGSYVGPDSPVCSADRKNCLVSDQSTLGLAPALTETHLDNLTALEVSIFADAEQAYLTFTGSTFAGNEATIYVYAPSMGSFEPETFLASVYANAADLGLQSGDIINALAVSDVTPDGNVCAGDGFPCEEDYDCQEHGTPIRCVGVPDGIWNTGDEVLVSLAWGSPTLTELDYSAADIFYASPSGSLSRRIAADKLGLLDTDDVDAIDVSPGFGRKDCNNNGVIDQCDIDREESRDDDNNGVPDECQDKNRYISFWPGNELLAPGENVALQVKLMLCAHCGAPPEELTWWIQEPYPVTAGVPEVEEYHALLGTEPYPSSQWDTYPFLHVGDCEVVPAAIYRIQASPDGGATFYPSWIDVLTVARPYPAWWADIVGCFDGEAWTRPNGVVNFLDISAAVQYFTSAATAPHLTMVDIEPQEPNRVLNFADIQQIVYAFQGNPYPFSNPANCP